MEYFAIIYLLVGVVCAISKSKDIVEESESQIGVGLVFLIKIFVSPIVLPFQGLGWLITRFHEDWS